MNFKNLLEVRQRKIDELSSDEWWWIKEDTGAWGCDRTGPIGDWSSHKDLFYKYVKKFDVVVTAGANCGMYTRFHAQRFKSVYAFEPDWLNFYCMVLNNPEEKVYKFNAALGEASGVCGVSRKNSKNVGMHQISAWEGNVPMIALDSLNLPSVDLIQLDVEGFEENAIKGAIRTIERDKPVIIAERGDTKGIKNLLEPLGYTMVGNSVSDYIYIP